MVRSIYRWLLIGLVTITLTSARPFVAHPFHVSVVEITHNANEKRLEISCKIFTDDFEKALAELYNAKVDLINPPDKKAMDTLVKKYIFSHLLIKPEGKAMGMSYVGFEKEDEAVYCYSEIDNVPGITKIDIVNKLMQDMFNDQLNLVHVIVGGNRKSTKLEYPANTASFTF